MKNRTKNIIKSFAVLFVIYGCNDSFLERQPLDQISDASFWNTENDLMVYNHSFYDNELVNLVLSYLVHDPYVSSQLH